MSCVCVCVWLFLSVSLELYSKMRSRRLGRKGERERNSGWMRTTNPVNRITENVLSGKYSYSTQHVEADNIQMNST